MKIALLYLLYYLKTPNHPRMHANKIQIHANKIFIKNLGALRGLALKKPPGRGGSETRLYSLSAPLREIPPNHPRMHANESKNPFAL
jgi:hypothetical protein